MHEIRIVPTTDRHIAGFNRCLGVVARERRYTRAIALYERLGFVREGVRHRARKLDDAYEDIILMALVSEA